MAWVFKRGRIFPTKSLRGSAAFATRNPKDIGAVADRFAVSKIPDHELIPLEKNNIPCLFI